MVEFASCHWPNLTCYCYQNMEPNQCPYTIFSDGKYHCGDCKKEVGETTKGMKIHISRIHEPDQEKAKKQKKKSKKKVNHNFTIENKELFIQKEIEAGWRKSMQIKEHHEAYEKSLKTRYQDTNYPSLFLVQYDNYFSFRNFSQKNPEKRKQSKTS